MTFPYYFDLAGLHLHPHPVLEVVAYAGGFQIYLWLRRRAREKATPLEQNMWVLVGAVFGALVGSKLLAWAESWPEYWAHRDELQAWLGGKTVVGGLLGGWAGVEVAKRCVGVTHRTGDFFILPLAFGMAVGRIGCFLTGLTDHTYGIATSVPWGVDFGDGIPRHPTQLYESAFIALWGCLVWCWVVRDGRAGQARRLKQGDGFRIFILGYLAMRLAIEFLKPTWKAYGGLSAIQWACVIGAAVCATQLMRGRRRPAELLARFDTGRSGNVVPDPAGPGRPDHDPLT
jgi:prolipoprotein diacylglyceryltransferase